MRNEPLELAQVHVFELPQVLRQAPRVLCVSARGLSPVSVPQSGVFLAQVLSQKVFERLRVQLRFVHQEKFAVHHLQKTPVQLRKALWVRRAGVEEAALKEGPVEVPVFPAQGRPPFFGGLRLDLAQNPRVALADRADVQALARLVENQGAHSPLFARLQLRLFPLGLRRPRLARLGPRLAGLGPSGLPLAHCAHLLSVGLPCRARLLCVGLAFPRRACLPRALGLRVRLRSVAEELFPLAQLHLEAPFPKAVFVAQAAFQIQPELLAFAGLFAAKGNLQNVFVGQGNRKVLLGLRGRGEAESVGEVFVVLLRQTEVVQNSTQNLFVVFSGFPLHSLQHFGSCFLRVRPPSVRRPFLDAAQRFLAHALAEAHSRKEGALHQVPRRLVRRSPRPAPQVVAVPARPRKPRELPAKGRKVLGLGELVEPLLLDAAQTHEARLATAALVLHFAGLLEDLDVHGTRAPAEVVRVVLGLHLQLGHAQTLVQAPRALFEQVARLERKMLHKAFFGQHPTFSCHQHLAAVRDRLAEHLAPAEAVQALDHFPGQRLLVVVLHEVVQPLAKVPRAELELAGHDFEAWDFRRQTRHLLHRAQLRVHQAIVGPHQIKQIQIKPPFAAAHNVLKGPFGQ